jgi:circadian clock protein KaiC
MHLARKIKSVTQFEPDLVIIDPISGLDTSGTPLEVHAALIRLLDWLKLKGITVMLTDLAMGGAGPNESAETALSSLVDTWLLLRDIESNGERNRGMHVLKSRGMGHSNQVREFVVTDSGIQLTDVYIGPTGVLTGSARLSQQARERAERVMLNEEAARQQTALDCKREALEGQIATLRAEFAAEEGSIARIFSQDKLREVSLALDEAEMGRSRHGDIKAPRARSKRHIAGGKQS